MRRRRSRGRSTVVVLESLMGPQVRESSWYVGVVLVGLSGGRAEGVEEVAMDLRANGGLAVSARPECRCK